MKKCPHCGRVFDDSSEQQAHTSDESSGHLGTDASSNEGGAVNSAQSDESFIDSNYFRLLGTGTGTGDISNGDAADANLPETLFTQGYFENFFQEIELLGRGARGSVYKVEHILNGISLGYFALKKITIGDDSKWLLKVLKEVTMLCKISFNNNNLVNYNHVWLEISSINDFGPKVPCAYILQQYCSGGNLEEFITNLHSPVLKPSELKKWKLSHKRQQLRGRLLNNEETLLIFSQIVSGVHELHKNHIIHRDLKPSNCLLAQPYFTDFTQTEPDLTKLPTILVSDFGESQLEGEIRNATGSTGTLEYTAPELLNLTKKGNIPQFNKKTDVYSLGMILYFMCFGRLPYSQSADLAVLKNEIEELNLDELTTGREGLLPEFKYLIKNLTSRNSEERLSTGEIIDVLRKAGSIDHLEIDEEPPIPRRLSLTNGKDDRLDKTIERLKNNQMRIFITLINVSLLKIISWPQILCYVFIFAMGVTINQDIRQTYILSITMIITTIILTIYNYITQ